MTAPMPLFNRTPYARSVEVLEKNISKYSNDPYALPILRLMKNSIEPDGRVRLFGKNLKSYFNPWLAPGLIASIDVHESFLLIKLKA